MSFFLKKKLIHFYRECTYIAVWAVAAWPAFFYRLFLFVLKQWITLSQRELLRTHIVLESSSSAKRTSSVVSISKGAAKLTFVVMLSTQSARIFYLLCEGLFICACANDKTITAAASFLIHTSYFVFSLEFALFSSLLRIFPDVRIS